MFQFAGFAFYAYVFSAKYLYEHGFRTPSQGLRNSRPAGRMASGLNSRLEGGFPHSEIYGSKAAPASP